MNSNKKNYMSLLIPTSLVANDVNDWDDFNVL